MRNYLDDNLLVLEKVNPTLAGIIRSDWDHYNFLQIKESGEANFRNLFINKGNKIFSAYGVDNQSENIKKEVEKFSFPQDGGTIIIGMGLGHFTHEICQKKDKAHILVVVEPIPYLLKEALSEHNFAEWIKNGTLLFACPDEIELQMVMGMVESNCVVNNWNIIIEPYTTNLPDQYSSVTIYSTDLLNQIRCNTGTVMGNGKIIAQNDIRNLPYILSSWGIDRFQGIFKDKPAVIVSTGPSLRKNIHLLKNYKGKVVIICVAQALRILLSYDIVPDFACTVDYGEVNYEHFKGLMDCGVPLIALNRSFYKILQEWKSPKIICTSPANMEPRTTMSYLAEYGWVEQGGSVSHMAVGCALKFGCNPIILIGQDLAYEKNLSHNPNADASGEVEIGEDNLIKWRVNDPKSILKDQECIMGVVQDVPGFLDNSVQTNVGLLSFITSFRHIFDRYKETTTFINATEGGADLKGAKNMVLRDALKKYKVRTIQKKKFLDLLYEKKDVEKACKEVLELVTKDMEDLRGIAKSGRQGIAEADEAIRFYNSKRKLHRHLDKNAEHSNKAHELAKRSELMNIAIYYASRAIYSKELKVDGSFEHISKNKKDFLTRINRNKLILNAAIKESTELLSLYEITRNLLCYIESYGDDQYVLSHTKVEDGKVIIRDLEEVENEKANKVQVFDLDSAEKYFQKGNFSYPYLEAKKAITYLRQKRSSNREAIKKAVDIQNIALRMRKKTIDEAESVFISSRIRERLKVKSLIEEAIKAGKNKEFDRSISLIKEAHLLLPEDELVMWGLASVNFFLAKKEDGSVDPQYIDASIKHYKLLISKYPQNLRYQYEYGNVLLNLDPETGIKQIVSVMKKTEQFDHFFRHIGRHYFLKEDYEKAAEAYEKYVDRFPADFEALRVLAECYEKLKDNRFEEIADKYFKLTGNRLIKEA